MLCVIIVKQFDKTEGCQSRLLTANTPFTSDIADLRARMCSNVRSWGLLCSSSFLVTGRRTKDRVLIMLVILVMLFVVMLVVLLIEAAGGVSVGVCCGWIW